MNRLPYPKGHIDERCGCKVSWRTYPTKRMAEACAVAAKHNAKIAEAEGYDFGYQSPGSITELDGGGYEVVLP